jgi:hypothetical protein
MRRLKDMSPYFIIAQVYYFKYKIKYLPIIALISIICLAGIIKLGIDDIILRTLGITLLIAAAIGLLIPYSFPLSYIPSIRDTVLKELYFITSDMRCLIDRVLTDGTDEVICHGKPSYLMMLKSDIPTIFQYVEKINVDRYPIKFTVEYNRVRDYIDNAQKLRQLGVLYGNTKSKDIYEALLAKNGLLTLEDWAKIGKIAKTKLDMAQQEEILIKERYGYRKLELFFEQMLAKNNIDLATA